MRTFSLSDETWDSLLAPISEEAPSGEALRYEGTYDRVIEMRRQDRADLPQGGREDDRHDAAGRGAVQGGRGGSGEHRGAGAGAAGARAHGEAGRSHSFSCGSYSD